MPRGRVKQRAKPSAGEMELLSLLWQHGSMTLSQMHEAMGQSVGYTTVQTRLNRLVDKDLATKQKIGRTPTEYVAAVEASEMGASQLDTLVERVANGSVVPLVAHLLDAARLSSDELQDLKRLVKRAEQKVRDAKGDAS
jgi:BlaI family penicillinase repressor